MTAPRSDAARPATGPTTPEGKARSSLNALKHGLCSPKIVLPKEDPAAWDTFLADTVSYFDPIGAPELELVQRYASCTWRLRRVADYEADVTALRLDEVQEDVLIGADDCQPAPEATHGPDAANALKNKQVERDNLTDALLFLERFPRLLDGEAVDLNAVYEIMEVAKELVALHLRPVPQIDADFFNAIGVPDGQAFDWDGWTAGHLRHALALLADAAGWPVERYLPHVVDELRERIASAKREIEELVESVKNMTIRLAQRVAAMERRRRLPSAATQHPLDRHEAHLERQARRALETLNDLQDRRRAREEAERVRSAVPPPPADHAPNEQRGVTPPERAVDATPAPVNRVRSALSPTAPRYAAPRYESSLIDTPEEGVPVGVGVPEPSANGREVDSGQP